MKEKKNEEINDKDRKLTNYESIISIWKRMDESYWTSVNVFILIVGLLLAGYSQIIEKPKPLLYVYCIAGILICLIWLFVSHKKMAFTYIAEDIGRQLEEIIYSDLKKLPSGKNFAGGFFTMSKNIFDKDADKEIKDNSRQWLNDFFNCRKVFTKVGSAKLMSFYLPIVMIVVWIGILVVTWLCL